MMIQHPALSGTKFTPLLITNRYSNSHSASPKGQVEFDAFPQLPDHINNYEMLMDRIADILLSLRNNTTFKYTFCVAAFLLALVIRLVLDRYLPPGYPFLTFFPAVILSTLVAGVWAGIVSTVACGLAALYFFIQPIYSFELNYSGILALTVYCFVAGIDIALIHVMTRALDQLRAERNRSADLTRRTEIMFSELQHRVSNNLQTIAGLLLLQESEIEDAKAQHALKEARNRITLLGNCTGSCMTPTWIPPISALFWRSCPAT
jgi:K+-sensing histidine kinase KdpD